jgi:hypothetical protein
MCEGTAKQEPLAELFGQPKLISNGSGRVGQQHDLDGLGLGRERCRLDVHYRTHAEGRPVMLIEHYAAEVKQLVIGVNLFVEILVE